MSVVDQNVASRRAAGARLVELLSNPAAIALVGASAKPGAVSARPLEYLTRFGFAGGLHVVHPSESEVLGVPAVATVEDLPDGIDVAMLTLPAKAVPDALRALDARGVGVAVSVASGFEAPDEPLRIETLEVLANSNIRLVGPNCTGIMTPPTRTLLSMSSFYQRHEPPPTGRVAVVSQTGGIGNGLLMSMFRRGSGLSHLFTTGNELNIGCLELVSGLLVRDDVDAVGLFIEGITDVQWLDEVAALIEASGKPVMFYKTARTAAGRVAAGGHTGRVVGPADVASAMLCDAGMQETRDLEQLSDALVCASHFGSLPRGRVAIVTMSGSTAVLASDQIQDSNNLELGIPDEAARDTIAPHLDSRLVFGNPIDVGINETLPIANTMNLVRSVDAYDVVLGVVTSLAHDPKTLVDIVTEASEPGLPMVLTYLSQEDGFPNEEVARLARHGIAVVPSPERAVMALDLITTAGPKAGGEDGHDDHDTAGLVGIEEIAAASGGSDIRLAPWVIADDTEAAVAAGEQFGFPVVVKVAGRTLHHRSDVGGVAVGVTRESMPEVFARIKAVADEHGDSVMVQSQSAPGFELMMSGLVSPEFGPVVIVRPGGVLAELMRAQVVLAGRWTAEHRAEVLRASTVGRVLTGYRGGRVYDLDAIAALAGALAGLLETGGFEFIELNPVIAQPAGVCAVDALGRRA